MENENGSRYSTKDFYIAAFLLTKGLKLFSIDRTNPREAFFIFQDTESKEALVEGFFYGRATVEPKAFVSAIKELKQLLYSHN